MARTETHECRNCGAPLGIPKQHDRYFTCGSCGSVLEDVTPPDRPAGTRIEITVPRHPTVDPSTLQSYSEPARAIGGIIVAVIVLCVIGAAGAVIALAGAFETPTPAGTASTADGSSVQIYNYATAELVPGEDGSTPDVVAVARTSDDAQIVLMDADAEPAIRWSVPMELESDVFTQFVTTDELVVVQSGPGLVALDRASGERSWSATLSDSVEPNLCAGCLRRFGDSIVTLTADGVLASRPIAGGEQQWSATLAEVPRQVVDVGGKPGVLDTADGVTSLHVFSLTDGAVVERLPLSCPDTIFGGRSPVNIYDTLFETGDGRILYLADPAFGGCIQIWGAGGGGGPQTEMPYEYPDPSGATPTNVLVAGAQTLVADGTVVDVVPLDGGAPRRVADLPDTDLYPIGLTESVAVVAAESTRGTPSWSVIALDLGSGAVRWTFELEATESTIEGRSFAVDDAWTAAMTSAGVSVVQYRSESVELDGRTIPVDTGTPSPPVVTDVSGRGFSESLSVYGWEGDDLLLAMNGSMLTVDGPSGTLVREVP